MKKIVLLLAVLAVSLFCLASCGNGKADGTDTLLSDVVTKPSIDDIVTDLVGMFTDTADGTADILTDIETGLDSSVPEDSMGNGGMTASPAKVLADAASKVRAACDKNYDASLRLEKASFLSQFGINEDIIENYTAQVSLSPNDIDTFVGVCAKEGCVEKVRAALYNFCHDYKQLRSASPVLSQQIGYSEIKTYGNYVFLVMFGSEEEELGVSQFSVNKAVDALDKYFNVK